MAEIVEITKALQLIGGFTPLQRILLTCSGTLQTTLSAYFGSEVIVKVITQEREDNYVIKRDALLKLKETGVMVCRAASHITTTQPDIQSQILKKGMGIGQILEAKDIHPKFKLLGVAQDEINFQRTYKLEAPGIAYRITEIFPKELYQ